MDAGGSLGGGVASLGRKATIQPAPHAPSPGFERQQLPHLNAIGGDGPRRRQRDRQIAGTAGRTRDRMANADDIIAADKQLLTIPANARECNEFLIAAAARFGIILSGIADQIMVAITGGNWTQHEDDGKARERGREKRCTGGRRNDIGGARRRPWACPHRSQRTARR
jgi:hypothetical protein